MKEHGLVNVRDIRITLAVAPTGERLQHVRAAPDTAINDHPNASSNSVGAWYFDYTEEYAIRRGGPQQEPLAERIDGHGDEWAGEFMNLTAFAYQRRPSPGGGRDLSPTRLRQICRDIRMTVPEFVAS